MVKQVTTRQGASAKKPYSRPILQKGVSDERNSGLVADHNREDSQEEILSPALGSLRRRHRPYAGICEWWRQERQRPRPLEDPLAASGPLTADAKQSCVVAIGWWQQCGRVFQRM